MSLKIRAILVLAIGTILGVSLSLGGAILSGKNTRTPGSLTWDQSRLLAEVMALVKDDYVEDISDTELGEKSHSRHGWESRSAFSLSRFSCLSEYTSKYTRPLFGSGSRGLASRTII
ncbi:MAG: hypothetical protein Ct9H300mP22_5140 [Gammaproteobacteria bacterium]|nr:MAG: hypothetical protein Ct9H300mP22_5140 [Gammaproteobacteria bacterium]